MSMKIAIDARLYGVENTGIGRYITNLIDNLAKIDSKNTYYVLVSSKYFSKLNYPNNFQLIRADMGHYSFGEQIRLPLILAKLKPDVVHFPHFNVPLVYRGNYVVTIHDLLMHHNKGRDATTLPYPMYLIKRLGYKLVFGNAVRSAKKIIVPSNTVKNDLISYYKIYPKKVVRIYEGVDKYKKAADVGKTLKKYSLVDGKYFIYVGNAYPHKNLDRLIGAFVQLNDSMLKNQHSGVVFAIVSARGVFTNKLVKLVAKYKARGYVKLLGYVPDSELSVLLSKSTAFVSASLLEGFGLPVLEAMEAGTIALVSEIPVYKEIYRNSVMYFDPYSADSIKNGLERVVALSGKERARFVKRGKELAKCYSWQKMAEQAINVYEDVDKLR